RYLGTTYWLKPPRIQPRTPPRPGTASRCLLATGSIPGSIRDYQINPWIHPGFGAGFASGPQWPGADRLVLGCAPVLLINHAATRSPRARSNCPYRWASPKAVLESQRQQGEQAGDAGGRGGHSGAPAFH